MTSKLVVNTIEADTGISSVSFASSISLSSTSKFFFSDAGIDIGPDTNINRPATGVLGFNINGSEKVRINSTGKVGIGTNNPSSPGTYTKFLEVSDNNSSSIIVSRSASGTAHKLEIGAFSGASLIESTGATSLRFKTNSEERLRITANGDVGIGTINPSTNLHIVSDKNALIKLVSTDAYSGIQFIDPDTGSKAPNIYGIGDDFTIWTNWTERLRVKLDGKIGIGVTNPDSNLEINRGSEGKYLTVGGDDASNGRGLSFTSSEGGTGSNGALHTINAKSGNGAIALATAGTERFRIDRDGNITRPFQPAFSARGNSSPVDSSEGYTGILSNYMTTMTCNIGSHYKTSGSDIGNFVAPVAGNYFFSAGCLIRLRNNSSSGFAELTFHKNGSNISARSLGYSYVVGSSDHDNITINSIIPLAAGDKVALVAHNCSSVVDFYWGQGLGNFHGYLIG